MHGSNSGVDTIADAFSLEAQPATDDVTQEQLKVAETEHVEARAAYLLRQSVEHDILVAAPILKSIHAGPNATSTER